MKPSTRYFKLIVSLLTALGILLGSPGSASAVSLQLSPPGAAAQPESQSHTTGIALESASDNQIRVNFVAAPYSIVTDSQEQDPLTTLTVPDMWPFQAEDTPALPVQQTTIAIPAGASYHLMIGPVAGIPIEGFYRIAPAPVPAPLEEDFTPGKVTAVPFSSISARDHWFPESPVRIIEEAWIRTTRVLRLEYSPFQYNPARGELRWVPQVQATIILDTPFSPLTASSEALDRDPASNLAFAEPILNSTQAQAWRTTALALSPNKGEAYPGQHSGTPAARIGVAVDGLYRLTYLDLVGMGFNVNHNPRNFHLYNQGRPIAFRVEGDDGDSLFENFESLLFFGQKFDGAYLETVYRSQMANWFPLCVNCRLKGVFETFATENVYWLTAESTPGVAISTRSAIPQDTAPVPTSYLQTVKAEKQEEWWSHHFTSEDSFFYAPRLQSSVTTTYTFGITLTGVDSSAPAAVVNGSMAWRNNLANHNTTFYFNHPANPVVLATSNYSGIGRSFFAGSLPVANLLNGENQLKVRLEKNPAGPEFGYLDYFTVDYWRTFTPVNDQLIFSWASAGTFQFAISSLGSAAVYGLDVTNPIAPVLLTGVRLGSGQADFQDSPIANARYAVVGSNAVKAPVTLVYTVPADLNAGNGAEYVMIAHKDLLAATQVLADFRIGQGMSVKVVNVADVYDQHNFGIRHPIAIRNYLERGLASWSVMPVYALLVGDGHFNMVNSPLFPNFANQMPPNLAFVDPWQGEVDSSSLLAMIVGDDRIPDVHIGRIPASTPEQFQAVADKIIAYEQSPVEPWQRHYLFMHDNVPDTAGDFDESALWLRDQILLGAGTSATILDGNVLCGIPGGPQCLAARNAFTSTLTTQGALMATYIGHGALSSWASEIMMGPLAAQGMKNTRLPVILSLTCLDGFWFHPGSIITLKPSRTLSDYFIFTVGGGAVASISPTGLGVGSGHDLFAQGIFNALHLNGVWRLGALVDAGRFRLTSSGVSPDLVYTFTVLGDPALRLKSPFSLNSSVQNPNGKADPGASYTYTIQIQNTAPVPQSFTVSEVGLGWITMSLPAQLTLAAGDSGSMQLRVDIPLNAPRGTIYPFSIKVSSTGDSELYKTSPAALEVNYRMLFLPSATRP